MADTNPSANMNLPVPAVGVDPGPQWASDLNTCLTLIDAHDHSSGNGVQVTPAGLNINAELTINNNNLTNARSVRFQPQGSPIAGPSDLGCLYESGVDLYYNDGSGNRIRLTALGTIAGATGSIGGLVSPAAATYVAVDGTFVWQSGSGIPANLDAGSIILRNASTPTFGVTIGVASQSADYDLTLPGAAPSVKTILTMDSGGNVAASYTVDELTVTVNDVSYPNEIRVKDGGIDTAQLSAGVLAQLGTTSITYAPGSYSWTAPAGVNAVVLCMRSGSGGGGGGGSGDGGNGGGGAGCVSFTTTVAVTPGNSYAVVVGAAGAAGTAGGPAGHGNPLVPGGNGGNGGATSFGSIISIPGGEGGIGGTGGTNGAGGASRGAPWQYSGGAGGAPGAAGSSSIFASGGAGGANNTTGSAGGGGAGEGAGGAGGAGNNGTAVGLPGGAGTNGGGGGGGSMGGNAAAANEPGGAGGAGTPGFLTLVY